MFLVALLVFQLLLIAEVEAAVSVFTTWISKGRYPRPTGWEPAGAALALG